MNPSEHNPLQLDIDKDDIHIGGGKQVRPTKERDFNITDINNIVEMMKSSTSKLLQNKKNLNR
jgi:hypothetical protein